MTMLYPQDEAALKVCVDTDGVCWHVVGTHAPVCTEQSVDEYVQRLVEKPPAVSLIRVLSCAAANRLIPLLYQRVVVPNGWRLQLASPNSVAVGATVVATLGLMRRCLRTPEQGGWRNVGDATLAGYIFANQLAACPDSAISLFDSHPAANALKFVTDLQRQAAGQLLAELVDPYRFIDPRSAQRPSRLFTFLGLYPTDKPIKNAALRRRRDLAVTAWSATPMDFAQLHKPGCFVWRCFSKSSPPAVGMLRATQLFVRFLYLNWMDAIRAERTGRSGRLFSPEQMFKDPITEAAFRQHCSVAAGV